MSELFLSFFNRAMAAGWVALAVIVLRLLIKKAPKWVDCLLWALVGIRLVWPFSLQSAVSLLPSREVLPPEALFDRTPEVQTGLDFVNTRVNASFTPAMTPAELTSINPLQVWTWAAGWLWALGAAALLLWALISFLRLRKQVAASVERDGLWFCDGLESPFILGVFRPRIYVPSSMDAAQLQYVAAHEYAHLRRRDHWWKPLAYVLLALHWFQPLLWAAYLLLCRDIELACDEKVVQTLELQEKKAYSHALLACSISRRRIAACPLAFGEVGVKTRIKSVLHYKKPAFWIVAVCVVLCIVLAVCFLTDPVGFRLEFELEDITQATTMDLRRNSGPDLWTLTDAQEEELWFRLRDLKKTRRADVYGGFTPFYSLSVQLQDGQWLRIQGYDMEAEMVDLVWKEQTYQVQDADFRAYLERLCAGADRAEVPRSTGQMTDAAYYTSDCVFLNPLSSAMASADSGYYYYVQDNTFVTGYRRTMTEQAVPVHWSWQAFPWTAEAWNEKFWGEPVDISGYTDRKYQRLDLEHYLLQMDGELWLVEDHGDSRLGIWSIYRLTRAESLSQAQWMYLEGAGQPLTIQFDLEYDEIQLTCTGGALHGAYENVNDDLLHYYGDQILYWTAAASEDAADVAWEAEIFFTGYLDGEEQFYGSIRTSIDRNGDVWVNGGTLGGNQEMRMDREDHFVRIYLEDREQESEIGKQLQNLQPGDLTGVALHNDPGSIDLEHLRQLLQQAAKNPVNGQVQPYVGWEIQITLAEAPVLALIAGTVENQVEIRQEDHMLCVSDEELYWIVRTCNDTEPAGIDPVGYELCRELVDGHLNTIPELPADMKKEQVTKELLGLTLADSSAKLNAQAWRMQVAWNVEPPEKAPWLVAGGAQVDSQLRCRGMNASATYIIVVDDEPIGFVGWWFLMDKTLDEQFDTKEALIAAVLSDG